jgi:signal transduction histidine kinase
MFDIKNTMTLHQRLYRLLGLLTLLMLLGTGLSVGLLFWQHKQSELEDLQQMRTVVRSNLENYFSGYWRMLDDVSNNLRFQQGLSRFSQAFSHGGLSGTEWEKVAKEFDHGLQSFMTSFGFDDVFLINEKAQVVYSDSLNSDVGADLNAVEWHQSVLAKIFFTVTQKDHVGHFFSQYSFYPPANKQVAFIATPLYRDRVLQGVVVFQLSMESINQIVQLPREYSQTGETVLAVKQNGISQFINPLRFEHEVSEVNHSLRDKTHWATSMKEALDNTQGFGQSIDYRGESILAAWDYLPSLGWGLVVKRDLSEVMKPLWSVILLFIMGVLLVMGVVFSVSRELLRRLSSDVSALVWEAETLGKGELLSTDLNRSETLEFSRLQAALNAISERYHSLSRQAVRISYGHYTERVSEYSEKDFLAKTFNAMGASLRLLHDYTLTEKNFSHLVFQSLQNAVVVLDAQGHIKQLNNTFSEWTEKKTKPLLQEPSTLLFDDQDIWVPTRSLMSLQKNIQNLVDNTESSECFDDTLLGVFWMNTDGRMVASNPVFIEQMGWSFDVLTDHVLEDLLPESQQLYCRELLSTVVTDVIPQNLSQEEVCHLKLGDGSVLRCWILLVPICRDETWQIMGIVCPEMPLFLLDFFFLTDLGACFDQRTPDEKNACKMLKCRENSMPVMMKGRLLKDHEGALLGAVFSLSDQRLQKQHQEREKFMSFQQGKAEMNATVLHNVGNILSGIEAHTESLKSVLKGDSRHVSLLEHAAIMAKQDASYATILKTGSIAEKVLMTLKGIAISLETKSKSGADALEKLQNRLTHLADIIGVTGRAISDSPESRSDVYVFDAVIDDVLVLLDDKIKAGAVLMKKEYSSGLELTVDRNGILQMLVNLFKNALEAIYQRAEDDEPTYIGEVRIIGEQLDTEFLLTIQDNGVGFDAEQKKTLFRFGSTSKEDGSGIGLHSSANFMRAHNGEISADSNGINQGCRITLLFRNIARS